MKTLSYLLFSIVLFGIINFQKDSTITTYELSKKKFNVQEENVSKAAQSLKNISSIKLAGKRPGKEEISGLASKCGLDGLIDDISPSSAFVSYWSEKHASEATLKIEFTALRVFLEAAKSDHIDTKKEKLYSPDPRILADIQSKRPDLEKIGLVEVPDLGNLSRDEAENELIEKGLVPNVKTQHVYNVPAGFVIPLSQDSSPKLKVKPGTIVTFGVSAEIIPLPTPPPSIDKLVSIVSPKTGGKILCEQGGDGIYRFQAKGTSSEVTGDGYGLLLWVQPVQPKSDRVGWYLMRPPVNGISGIESNGSWTGTGQLGNEMYPPHEGNIFDLAVSIAKIDTINELIAKGGVIVLPQPIGIKTDIASGLLVRLK